MPLYSLREIWTPLKFLGIKLFKSDDYGDYFFKIWNNRLRRVKWL